MNASTSSVTPENTLVLEYEFAAPPAKVWRAISIPAFREHWLPDEALADAEPIVSTPDEEVRYRLRNAEPPFLESEVSFFVAPNETGGTRLKIVHRLTDPRLARHAPAVNDDVSPLMRAA